MRLNHTVLYTGEQVYDVVVDTHISSFSFCQSTPLTPLPSCLMTSPKFTQISNFSDIKFKYHDLGAVINHNQLSSYNCIQKFASYLHKTEFFYREITQK